MSAFNGQMQDQESGTIWGRELPGSSGRVRAASGIFSIFSSFFFCWIEWLKSKDQQIIRSSFLADPRAGLVEQSLSSHLWCHLDRKLPHAPNVAQRDRWAELGISALPSICWRCPREECCAMLCRRHHAGV